MPNKPRSTEGRRRKRPDYSRKIGQPPGALIHLGDIKTARPTITLLDYDESALEEVLFDNIEASRAYQRRHGRLWLNVYGLQHPEVMAEVGQRFGLHPLTLEDILNTHQRPKLDDYGDYLFVVARAWRRDENNGELASDQISIVIGRGFLLTFQEQRCGLFEPVRERLRAGAGQVRAHGADLLAYALLDAVVDRYFSVLEGLGTDIDQAEDALGERTATAEQTMRRINRLKHDTRELRRTIWPLREVLAALQREGAPLVSDTTQLYLRDIYDHVVQVVESLDALRDATGDLLDLHLSLQSQRLNVEVRVLAVLSMLFMPATLISGVFGMNFRVMPWLDDPWGFGFALALMAAAAGGLAALFWQRRWLHRS